MTIPIVTDCFSIPYTQTTAESFHLRSGQPVCASPFLHNFLCIPRLLDSDRPYLRASRSLIVDYVSRDETLVTELVNCA